MVTRMLSPSPDQPVNLTAAVELGRLTDGPASAPVLSREHLAFAIHGVDELQTVAERVETDILYVIISGYGILCCADGERIEFTAGDVMFVPAGAEHRFDEIGPKFRTWRIAIGKPLEATTEEDGSSPK